MVLLIKKFLDPSLITLMTKMKENTKRTFREQNQNKPNNCTVVISDKVVHYVLSPIYAIVRR